MKVFLACLLGCSKWSFYAADPTSEETATDGDGCSSTGQHLTHKHLREAYSEPLRRAVPAAATESAAGTKGAEPRAPPLPLDQKLPLQFSPDQLSDHSTAFLDSLIVAITPACISVINLSGKMLHQNPQSRTYYGDRVGSTATRPDDAAGLSAEAAAAAAAAGTTAGAAACCGCSSSSPSTGAEADVLEQLFLLDPEKRESMRLMLRTTSSGVQAGVWKAVVRVPHSLNTGKSVLTAPAPLPLPSATASLAAEGTAELQLPAQTQMNSAIAVETRTAAFLRSGEAVPQLPARASWAAAATAPTCSSYSLAGIPTAAGVTMSIKYPQGAGRCLSQTNDRGIGCSCSGASRVKTEGGGVESRGGGGAGAAMDNDNDRVSHCANILRCLPQPCDSVSQMPAQHGQLLMKAIGGSSTAGTGPIVPRHMAAPLPHHRPSTPPQPQITHQHRMLAPTSSASIDAGLNSSGCLPVDPLATSTFSTLGAVPLVLTNPQRPSTSQRLLSSQLPSLSRTAPAQATSTVSPAAPSRISIDDPLCPINRAHGRRRALTAATSCVETSPIGIGSLWDLPRTTMSFRIRETLCTQLHKTSSGGRVRTDDAGDAWDVASGPQQQGRQLHSQPEQQRQQQQPQVQQPQQRQLRSIQASACTARAFAFALSLGTSPLGPHSASSIGGPFPHTSMPLILAQKKQEQEQERGEQQLAQQQDQNPITQQREKRQQQLGVWLVRHDTNTQQASSSLHSAAAGAASQTTAMASCDKPSPKMDFTGMHRTAARDSSEPVKQADVSMSATPAVLPAMISATRTTATTATLMTRDTIDGSHGTGVDGEFPEMYMFNSHQDHPLLFTAQEPDPAGSEAISHQQTWYRAPIVAERNVSSTRLQHLLDSEMRRPVVSSSTTTRKRFTNQQGEVPTTLLRLIADATISNVSAATAATVTTAHADADADDAKPFVMSLQQQGGVAAADDAAQRVPRRDSLHNSHLGPSPDFGTAGFRCNLLEPPREPKATADLQLPPHPEQPLGPAPGQRWEGECWHEVWMMPAKSPLTGEGIIIIKQIDVTAKVIAERHLALVMETEHRLVEQLFPRHILQYITEEWTAVAAAAKAAAEGQTPPPPTGDATAAMRRSHFGQHQHQPWGSDRWLPAIRNCTALATSHAEVTLLFADIKEPPKLPTITPAPIGFTPMCKEVEPCQTMTLLNELYSRYDALLDEYGVYKVETIGDCYFVAGGLMREDEDGMTAVCDRSSKEDPLHAERVLAFAKAMLVAARQVVMPTNGQPVEIRVGLHTGPVVSGVVGTRMPRFCLFGDTVNTASRMESTGVPGAIHASAATFRRLPRTEQAKWKPTGGIQVKGKGLMQTYLWMPSAAESN